MVALCFFHEATAVHARSTMLLSCLQRQPASMWRRGDRGKRKWSFINWCSLDEMKHGWSKHRRYWGHAIYSCIYTVYIINMYIYIYTLTVWLSFGWDGWHKTRKGVDDQRLQKKMFHSQTMDDDYWQTRINATPPPISLSGYSVWTYLNCWVGNFCIYAVQLIWDVLIPFRSPHFALVRGVPFLEFELTIYMSHFWDGKKNHERFPIIHSSELDKAESKTPIDSLVKMPPQVMSQVDKHRCQKAVGFLVGDKPRNILFGVPPTSYLWWYIQLYPLFPCFLKSKFWWLNQHFCCLNPYK